MRTQHWLNRKQRLESLFDSYDRLPESPPNIRAHWVRYLVVLTSGFLETSVSFIYTAYAEDKASPRLQKYVSAQLDSPGNLRMDRLCRLIGSFGEDWLEEVTQLPDYGRIKAAVDSIVSNRNNVAHGEDISTTILQLREYYDAVVILLDLLVAQCDRDAHTQHFTRRQRRRV